MNFRTKIILGSLLLQVVLLTVIIVSSMNFISTSNINSMHQHSTTLGKSLASVVSSAVISSDLATLQETVIKISNYPDVGYVEIFDAGEKVMAAAGDSSITGRVEHAKDDQYESLNKGIIAVSENIVVGDTVFGSIKIYFLTDHIYEIVAEAKKYYSFLAIISILLTIVFSFWLGTYLSKKWSALRHAASRIAEGEQGVLVPVDGADEIAQTSAAFNKMSADIEAATRQQKQLLTELNFQKFALDQHAIVSIANVKGLITYANDKFCKISGYSLDELVGKDHSIIKSDKHTDAFFKEMWRTIANGKVWNEVIRNYAKDGSLYWVDSTIVPCLDNEGKPFQYISIRTDITNQKENEGALKESEARLISVFDNTPVSLNLKDAEGRYILVNKPFGDWMGYPVDEIIGRKLSDFEEDPAEIENINASERRVFETGEPIEREVRSTGPDGNTYDRILIKFPIKLEAGANFEIGSVAIDITDRKRAEEASTLQVSEANRKLETALVKEREHSALQGEFVAMVSHEFRTPLAIIDGTAQRISRRVEKMTAEELSTRTDKIRKAVVRMMALIERSLGTARLDSGIIEMESGEVELAALITEVCQNQNDISPHHTISVDIDGISETMLGDPRLLEQIFTNLMSNAIKYAPDAPRVEVTGYQKDGEIIVTVRDYGVGIPAAELPKMFKRYFRASTASGIKGTGIGLNLVRELVEMHGGCVDVQSEENKGSLFTVRLPTLETTQKAIAESKRLNLEASEMFKNAVESRQGLT